VAILLEDWPLADAYGLY
jgi:hypothetical protein